MRRSDFTAPICPRFWTLVATLAFALAGAAQARKSEETFHIVCVPLAGEKQIQIYRQKKTQERLSWPGKAPLRPSPASSRPTAAAPDSLPPIDPPERLPATK